MTNNYPNLIPESVKKTGNRFPILIQLGLLSLVLLVMFGGWLVQSMSVVEEPKTPVKQNISTDNETYPITPQKIDNIDLEAKSAYVWDVRGQRSLYEKNSEETLPLASITKLMTTLLAYELADDNQITTISPEAIGQEGDFGLSIGEKLTIEKLKELSLISSSNDAAYELAASVGALLGERDPYQQFVTGMNLRAKELGLSSLEFSNPTGLDISPSIPGAVGNAKDVSFLMEYIITNHPEIIEPTKEDSTRVYNLSGAFHDVDNTNSIVTEIPNLIGSKTGFTDLAGGNLTVAFDAGLNRPIIVTVLGSTRSERFNDVSKLISSVQNSLGN